MGKILFYILSNFQYIFGAYAKYVSDVFRGNVSSKAKMRRAVCKECECSRLGICLKCGCVVAVKANVDYVEDDRGMALGGCPLGKW